VDIEGSLFQFIRGFAFACPRDCFPQENAGGHSLAWGFSILFLVFLLYTVYYANSIILNNQTPKGVASEISRQISVIEIQRNNSIKKTKFSILAVMSFLLCLFSLTMFLIQFDNIIVWRSEFLFCIWMLLSFSSFFLSVSAIIQRFFVKRRLWWLSVFGIYIPTILICAGIFFDLIRIVINNSH